MHAVVLVLLIVVVVSTYFAVLHTTRENLLALSQQQLDAATQVFDRAIDTRQRELSTSVRVLAADFGFKRAVATSDRATLVSALSNHGQRVGASLTLYLDRDGNATASTALMGDVDAEEKLLVAVRERATGTDRPTALIINHGGKMLQLVIAPVRAPQLIGWVAAGFRLDDAFAAEIRDLTNVHVIFVADDFETLASSLAATELPHGTRSAVALGKPDRSTPVELLGSEFLVARHSIVGAADNSVSVVLAASLDAMNASYTQLRSQLTLILALVLVLSWLGSSLLSNQLTRPLSSLAEAARRISRGEYRKTVETHGISEFDSLAVAFNTMQTDIRDREERIIYQAHHDVLTDLPNRALVGDRIQQAIRRADRNRSEFLVLLLDVDNFKSINDTLGHEIGDDLLVAVAHKLGAMARAADTVARLGGDEFLLLLDDTGLDAVAQIDKRLTTLFAEPIPVGETQLRVRVSGGVVGYPELAETGDELLRRADIALYDAKEADRTSVAVYEAGRDEERLRRLRLDSDLEAALEHGAIDVHYQPKLSLREANRMSVEALVRWQHPDHGFVSPEEFIPLAEQTGKIAQLTKFVLETVLKQLRDWRGQGLTLAASINLSAHDLLDEGLPGLVESMLSRYGLAAQLLTLEVTESAVMKDVAYARRVMERLRSLGIRLSIDDFGTGHASLAQLKRLPVDELKIDKSFVLELIGSEDDMIIVKSTIDLAHNMGLSVTAEGVENEESLAILEGFDCDVIQGYYISRPLDSGAMTEWLRAHGKPEAAEGSAGIENAITV